MYYPAHTTDTKTWVSACPSNPNPLSDKQGEGAYELDPEQDSLPLSAEVDVEEASPAVAPVNQYQHTYCHNNDSCNQSGNQGHHGCYSSIHRKKHER